jgi:hypothetical protein
VWRCLWRVLALRRGGHDQLLANQSAAAESTDFRKLVASIRKIGYNGYLRSEHLPTDRYNLPVRQSDVGTAWAQGYMRAIL